MRNRTVLAFGLILMMVLATECRAASSGGRAVREGYGVIDPAFRHSNGAFGSRGQESDARPSAQEEKDPNARQPSGTQTQSADGGDSSTEKSEAK